MKIALAQINTILGDFNFNTQLIKEHILKAANDSVDILVFPEATLFGYHPFDLLERQKLVEDQLKKITEINKIVPTGMLIVFGAFTKNPHPKGKRFYNSAIVLESKKKPKILNKTLLPTGDVFDEARFIECGDISKNIIRFQKKKILISICEDIWAWPDPKGRSPYLVNPINTIKDKKLDLIINISASPYFPGKIEQRFVLVKKTAQRFKAPMVYCNLVGGQDEIIFDGHSFGVNSKGQLQFLMKKFEEDYFSAEVDLDFGHRILLKNQPTKIKIAKLQKILLKTERQKTELEKATEIRSALVLGIKDFCRKVGLTKVHLGLSGGIDSAVVAALAVEAVGKENVLGIALPGPFSDQISLNLAKQLAKNLDIVFQEFSIVPAYELLSQQAQHQLQLKAFGLTHENLQARLRGLTLMIISNQKNSLLLSTSNKSEYATGYSTLYGDMCGGLAPIGDLLKRQVYQLAELYNKTEQLIPEMIITRPPTAELRPNQKDQDSLPPYDELDASVESIVSKGRDLKNSTDEWVFKSMQRSEFKRWQAPPILKVSSHSFGRGRRFPVSNRSVEKL